MAPSFPQKFNKLSTDVRSRLLSGALHGHGQESQTQVRHDGVAHLRSSESEILFESLMSENMSSNFFENFVQIGNTIDCNKPMEVE